MINKKLLFQGDFHSLDSDIRIFLEEHGDGPKYPPKSHGIANEAHPIMGGTVYYTHKEGTRFPVKLCPEGPEVQVVAIVSFDGFDSSRYEHRDIYLKFRDATQHKGI